MPKGPETRLVHLIIKALEDNFPGAYFRKIHGNPFQHVGIPDIIGCIHGLFIGLEVKTDEGKVSEVQKLEGVAIKTAEGVWAIVRSPEVAVVTVRKVLNQL
jgi:hypothetical protein